MMYVTDLSPEICCLFAGFLFLITTAVLALFLYQHSVSNRLREGIGDLFLFVCLLLFMSYLTASSDTGITQYPIRIPWILILLVSILIVFYIIVRFQKTYQKSKETLSASSIRQALDHLPLGICFADPMGNIVLINYEMAGLFTPLIGSYPQTLGDIQQFLKNVDAATGVCRLNESPELYRFEDDSIRQFHTISLDPYGLAGYTQTILQDVTQLYETNHLLRRENEQLDATNRELTLMYERLADRIREQETLNLKMKVHNDIGTSLIKISQIICEESTEIMDKQLQQLENAVSYFYTRPYFLQSDWNRVCEKANEMNVRCVLDGLLPEDDALVSLIADATGECVTNCVNHAEGSHVFVHVSENDSDYRIHITNDGKKPKGSITEGGGLSTLRKKIEQSGGTMSILTDPEFALILIFQK